jgi:hypothetical protein
MRFMVMHCKAAKEKVEFFNQISTLDRNYPGDLARTKIVVNARRCNVRAPDSKGVFSAASVVFTNRR